MSKKRTNHLKEEEYDFEELSCFDKIERKIKKIKPNDSFDFDEVKDLETDVNIYDNFLFNVIYNEKGLPIAEIDYLSFIKNKDYYTREFKSTEINRQLPKNSIEITKIVTEDKIGDLVEINISFENIVREIFEKEYDFQSIGKFFISAFKEIECYTDKIKHINLKGVKLSKIPFSMEPIKHVRMTSPVFYLWILQNEISIKHLNKILSKIYDIINLKAVINLLKVNNKDYQLFQMKEYYKLYKVIGDLSIFKVISSCDNNLLSAKFLYYTNKFIDGYLILKGMRHILKYKLEFHINPDKCLQNLSKDFHSYKNYLFFVWCNQQILKTNNDTNTKDITSINNIENLYKAGVETYNNIPCKLAHLRYLKSNVMYEDTFDEQIFYENYIIMRKFSNASYKYLSKFKKKLIKKKLSYDLLEQEMCYLENKDCKKSNKYYYLYKYKMNNKINCKDYELINGDSLIIMYIYNLDINYIKTIYNIYNFKNGFYWCRTRNILNFEERLIESKKIFKFDQDF